MEALTGRNRKDAGQRKRREKARAIAQAGLSALLILAAVGETPLAADYSPGFDRAIQFVKRWEGVHSDHPNDRGGETFYGLSSRHDPPQNWSEAKQVYYEDYWRPTEGVSGAMRFAVFDAAVQHGVATAKALLERVSGSQSPVRDYFAERAIYYHDIIENDPSQAVFERGWMRRLVAAAQYAQEIKHGTHH